MKKTISPSTKSIAELQYLSIQDTESIKGGLTPRQLRRLIRRLRNGLGTGPSSGIGNSGGGRPPMVTVNGMSR